jgi:hypothetical protein
MWRLHTPFKEEATNEDGCLPTFNDDVITGVITGGITVPEIGKTVDLFWSGVVSTERSWSALEQPKVAIQRKALSSQEERVGEHQTK